MFFGILFSITFILSISYFIKYFKSFNVPIEIDDTGITNLINKKYSIDIISLIPYLIISLIFTIIFLIKIKKKYI